MRKLPPQRAIKTLRRVTLPFLVDTCTLREPAVTSRDAQGGIIETDPTETPDVSCLLAPLGVLRPEEQAIVDKLTVKTPALIKFKHDQSINEQSEVVFDNGEVYQVRGFFPRGINRVFLEAVCERIR